MKVFCKIFFALLFCFTAANAQYEIKCPYLINPELIKGYIDSCAQFWMPSYDTVYGGFYSNVPRNGLVTDFNSKNTLTQSRTAYGMVRAFMLSGDTTYLKYARGAFDFMYENAWDQTNGGWFNEMDREGNILPNGDHNSDKWSFMQNYALVGIGAMVEATQNEKDWKYYSDGRAAVDSNLWDSRPDYSGYYNSANVDWSNPNGKGFTPTMDGITTHVLYYYLITGKPEYKERLFSIADNVVDYMLPAMNQFQYGYPEEFTNDWSPVLSNNYVFTGHLLKSAWCLTRAYLLEPNQAYLNFSTTILEEVLEQGYDNQYGGCYKEYNGATGQRYDSNKEWWELEQMFNSSIMNYYISSDERFLKAADETLSFYMNYFVDHTYGEVYQTTNRTGSPTVSSKASYWKAGYHSIELGYYVYLYGNLYLYHQPVSLYYYILPADSDRAIKLYPLAIEDDKLKISSVELNGDFYSDFLSSERTLNITAGTGGLFKVTFENPGVTGVATTKFPVSDFVLRQNYPNPFNSQTIIEYDLKENGHVTLELFDLRGRKIKVLADDYKDKGNHILSWNGKNDSGLDVASGIYFCRLIFNNHTKSKAVVLLK